MCCTEIIKQYEEKARIPGPTEMLENLFDSGAFRERVFAAFLANTNAVEKLASYLLIDKGIKGGGIFENFEFTTATIKEALDLVGKRLSPIDLYTITDNLVVSGVLIQQKGGNRFRFAVPQLARYWQNYDLKGGIEQSLAEIEPFESWSEMILAAPAAE